MRRGIPDRRTFARLRRDGVWIGGPTLRARYLAAPADAPVQVAYSTPKRLGSAVERNRIRRRIRGVLDELDRTGEGLPPGATLFVVDRPCTALDSSGLRAQVRSVITEIERHRDAAA